MKNDIVGKIMGYIDETLSQSGYNNKDCMAVLDGIIGDCSMRVDACIEGCYVNEDKEDEQ